MNTCGERIARMQGFLNESIITKNEKHRKRLVVWGIVLLVWFGGCGIAGLTGDENLRDGVGFYFAITALSIWFIIRAKQINKEIELAKHYNTVFICDENGIVDVGELEDHMGKGRVAIFDDLEKLLKKSYFVGVDLQLEGKAGVKLFKPEEVIEIKGYVTVNCPSCGATNRIKKGCLGTCKFCGGAIKD